ncbi:conserved hypothetical protein [Methanocella paludicola SANAE]|uniref:Spore protein YkvP/CgeB glycosyl transferase-like domain-containing protein n=1 Tax=Methanocella paludicola (strain DSM 17711 / JCM 13418 / NBRC 101707 / SANAE) TaxID=304371 RepID=D1YZY3_METPS|nr:glycosyltransferase [Methanocella paludicola]BAI62005.1 conserved hypothetical protein [Methanocella paludicola SANAE]
MKYDYGNPNQGYSFEHYNFYDSLVNIGHDILYFDYMTLMQQYGREWMNNKLFEIVKKENPDLMFTVLFKEELDKNIVKKISDSTDTITLNWFCDDHWRFDNFTKYWAPCFNYVVTTAKSALPKYEKMGYTNVIKSQWACNNFLYKKMELQFKYDSSFIGQPHGNRREIIQRIKNSNIQIETWGTGWESGRVTQEEMIKIFNQSRINLNLSNSSTINNINILGKIKSMFVKNKNDKIIFNHINNQIKGRNFEVPGCGSFMLTGIAEDLDQYYDINKEVCCFEDMNDLLYKINYYLNHDEERRQIANAGYIRTLKEHTYVHRFNDIFKHIAWASTPSDITYIGKPKHGSTVEIIK